MVAGAPCGLISNNSLYRRNATEMVVYFCAKFLRDFSAALLALLILLPFRLLY